MKARAKLYNGTIEYALSAGQTTNSDVIEFRFPDMKGGWLTWIYVRSAVFDNTTADVWQPSGDLMQFRPLAQVPIVPPFEITNIGFGVDTTATNCVHISSVMKKRLDLSPGIYLPPELGFGIDTYITFVAPGAGGGVLQVNVTMCVEPAD